MDERKADFAGSWYPGTETECIRMIEGFLSDAVPCPDAGAIIGGIVPHAGWFFSGHVACNVISCVRKTFDPDTWVIFGRHLHPSEPFYTMKQGSWSTPLGSLSLDGELAELVVQGHEFQIESANRHAPDNTIELQLPFLKYFSPDARILPIGAPPSRASLDVGADIAEAAKSLGRKIAVLGSTDLTHYGYNYGYAPKGEGPAALDWVVKENDRRIIDLITGMDAGGVLEEAGRNRNACCAGAVAAAVSAAKRLGAEQGSELVYATSYDKHKDTNFVGYVGVVFHL